MEFLKEWDEGLLFLDSLDFLEEIVVEVVVLEVYCLLDLFFFLDLLIMLEEDDYLLGFFFKLEFDEDEDIMVDYEYDIVCIIVILVF